MKALRIKDICRSGSSNLKQKDVIEGNGQYPVYGASGLISKIDSYHQENDYIGIVKDGSGIGRVVFLPAKSSVIGTMQYILPKEGFDINYIGYCLKSLDLAAYKQGAAIPHIYFKDYGERIVNVEESLEAQQSIVTYLDTSFSLIDSLAENAKKALENAKALFQAELKKLMEKKEGWEEKTMGELCNIMNGYAFPSKSFGNNYVLKCIKITNVGVGVFVEDECRLSEEYLSSPFKVKENDILIALTRTIINSGLKRARVPKQYDGALLNQRVASLTPNKNIVNSDFVYYYLGTSNVVEYVLSNVNPLMQPNLSITDLRRMQMPVPSLPEQQKIVQTLDTLSQYISQLEQNYNKTLYNCQALKQALLRETFE